MKGKSFFFHVYGGLAVLGLFCGDYSSVLNGSPARAMRLAQVSPPSRPLHGFMQAGSLTELQTRPARSSPDASLPVAQRNCPSSHRAPQRGQERKFITAAAMVAAVYRES